MRIFLSNCRTPSGLDNACVGKSKNGDCIAYQVAKDNSIIIFNLETGTFKTRFKLHPALLVIDPVIGDKWLYPSANDEGYFAVSNYRAGVVCLYDEDGVLTKAYTGPRLVSVDLINKGGCIIGNEEGILRRFFLKPDEIEIQKIGTISRCTTDVDLIEHRNSPMRVAVDPTKPTTIATINKEAVVNIFTDEAEAIEKFDRIGFAKSS
jgi:hypothetical protein